MQRFVAEEVHDTAELDSPYEEEEEEEPLPPPPPQEIMKRKIKEK